MIVDFRPVRRKRVITISLKKLAAKKNEGASGDPILQRSNQMGLGTLTSLLMSKRSDTRSSGHSQVEQPLTAELYAILHSHEISRDITAIPFFVETWKIRFLTVVHVNVSTTVAYGPNSDNEKPLNPF